jgi:hypothetical protein
MMQAVNSHREILLSLERETFFLPREGKIFWERRIVLHRHLVHEMFTLAGIDDVIARGGQRDWAALRRAALEDPAVFEKVRRVCRAHVADPYAQRYHFWLHYAEKHLA